MDSQSALRPQPGVQVLVGADASCVSAAYAYAQKLRGEGVRTAFCLSLIHILGGEIKSDLQRLPMLYGGPEVLDEAQAISSHPRCRAAIDNLREVYALLEAFGLSDYVSIYLGMVQAIGYYTGVIFKGMTGALGYPLLPGGRYDHLLRAFGRDLPATGFALGVKMCIRDRLGVF